VGRSRPWGSVHQEEKKGRDITERRSAPHQGSSVLERQLRSCRSAPDLALPALAATVRGLQDGTIQVDRHTRLQIACAAKRVLEAREAQRRLRQDKEVHPGLAGELLSCLDRLKGHLGRDALQARRVGGIM
jgi:hypothetical protein